ncbi:hypothetical protein [Jiangella endophytica]|uniref:hypothetical protein n=1 Tax=Jiangella endophytica TaxID=1623398 RepID=UPI000E34E751|nr:hypothetical protein [Jiangella endophytica]
MAYRTPVVVAAVLLAGCSGAEPGAEPAATPAPPPAPTSAATLLPGITDSGQLSEPVVVQGWVSRTDGTAVADALVLLAAHPTGADVAATGTGGSPLTPVAAARSGPDGRYELRIAAHLRAELPADEDGLVGFVVSVDSPDGRDQPSSSWTAPAEPTHPHTVDLDVSAAG